MTDAHTYEFNDARPENVAPIAMKLSGWYQADPYTDDDRPEGFEWRSAQWHEVINFVAIAPWNEVNRVIRGIAQDTDGNLIVAAGIDLSRFMVQNAVEGEDQEKMAALLNDRCRVLSQKTLGKVVFALIGEWGGRPTTR